jgi:hypothetical protein
MTARHPTCIASSTAARLALVACVATLGACSVLRPASQRDDPASIYERSTHRLSRAPEAAAACIVEHARASGHTADIVPLYGLQSVAVMVKNRTAGEVLVVLSLTPSDTGAVGATTTWKDAMKDRESFVRALVQGC